MGMPKLMKILGRVVLDMFVFFLLIVLLPGLPPHTSFSKFQLTPARKLEGRLTRNTKLANADALISDMILGPESIAVRGHYLYTGIIGGEVIRVKAGSTQIDKVAKFGMRCEGKVEESRCGRPLGMRFDVHGHLIVADAYYGLFKVDVDKKKVEVLVSSNDTIDGQNLMCTNDLDVTKSGVVYFTDSSKFHLQDTLYELLGEPTGRFLRYDPATKKVAVLMKDLHFSNGVQLFPDESSVLVSETARYRVWRYYIAGARAGEKEIFIDGLPGSPDNIRSNGRGGFFISLIAPRYAEKFSILDALAPSPWIRKFVARLLGMIDSTLGLVNSIFSNQLTQTAKYYVGHLEPIASILPKHGIILEVNSQGEIVGTLQDSSGKVSHISEISLDHTGKVAYLGSPYNTKIWKLNLEAIRHNDYTIEVGSGKAV